MLTAIVMLTAACRKDTCDNAKAGCSGCWKAASDVYFQGNYYKECICIPDSGYICPPSIVNGYYNYKRCVCHCKTGWKGTNCDQQDTAYFIRFRHGSDTTALSGILSTNEATLDIGTNTVKGVFIPGTAIDSVKILCIACFLGKGSYPLCGWHCSSYLEVHFANGNAGYSLTGAMIIDSVYQWYDQYGDFNSKTFGTFSSDLYLPGTGQDYYIRDGIFIIHGR